MSSVVSQLDVETFQTRQGSIQSTVNPMPELVRRKYATPVGNGLFVLSGPLVQLLEVIDQQFKRLAKHLSAGELSVPSILSHSNTLASEYLSSFKNQALMLRKNETSSTEALGTGEIFGLSCPAACYHYFASLQNTSLSEASLITTTAKCSRYEEGVLDDLSRLISFTMREIVGVGTTSDCNLRMEEIKKGVLAIYNDVFDLSYQICTASDPFFGPNQELKKKSQLLAQSKFEVLADLPYKKTGLAITSLNQHGEVFFHRFNFQGTGTISHSFCAAFGYERILYAVVSQKGTDFSSAYYKKLLSLS